MSEKDPKDMSTEELEQSRPAATPKGGTEMERMVWAAAFSAEWAREWNFRRSHHSDRENWGDCRYIPGFSCAEVADCALEAYRDSMVCGDAEYLIPVKENWSER